MNYNQWILFYFDRSNALQWYWTLYVVIVGGLLAFSSLRQRGDLLTTLIISILFCFFAYKNLGAIKDTTYQRYVAIAGVKEYSGPDVPDMLHRNLLEASLVAPSWEGMGGVRNFHITSDVLTVVCLWAMERRRRKFVAAAG